MIFSKPTKEEDYFKGILRNTVTYTIESSSYIPCSSGSGALLQNSLDKYWHSVEDASSNQYVEIVLPSSDATVKSYMISSGNDNTFYLKSWIFECSINGTGWTTIDSHKNEASFTWSKQMRLFDVQVVKKCNDFRFKMNGVENKGRYYMYIGPVEFYGILHNSLCKVKTCMKRSFESSNFVYIIFIMNMS